MTLLCCLIHLMTCTKHLAGLVNLPGRSPNITEELTVNISASLSINIVHLLLITTKHFSYLGGIVYRERGADLDIRKRIGKAIYRSLRKIATYICVWRAGFITEAQRTTKLVYSAWYFIAQNVGSSWKLTVHDLQKL